MILLLTLLFACESEPAADRPATPAASVERRQVAHHERFGLGRSATEAEIAAWDIDVDASFSGLPSGRGTVEDGRALFAQKCAACHGPDAKSGQGWIGPRLIATEPLSGFENDYKLPRSIGNWWPYASTLFDYVRRAMPQTAPGSLTADETYALVAFLLAENGAVGAEFIADQDSIRTVKMPTQVEFVRDDRESTTSFR